jgi:deoxyuridine 5'-triphosphate nucleotidohydrolase
MSNYKIYPQFNHNLFNEKNINSTTTYLLGFLSNTAYISKKNNILKFKLSKDYLYILDNLKLYLNEEILTYDSFDENNSEYLNIKIYSKTICDDYINLLQILPGKNYHLVKLPNLYKNNFNLFWNFINGYIDNNCNLEMKNKIPELNIHFNSEYLLKDFDCYIKIPHIKMNNKLKLLSTNSIDFLGEMYKNNKIYLPNLYSKFQKYINWKYLNKNNSTLLLDKCHFYKTDKDAIFPSKHYESDVGYDLTIIKKIKNLTPSTILYDTGIKLSVDYGYYIEIVPRSSLSKSGYILANSIGIIEKTYSGNLYVALTKIDKDMPDLELPFRCCQLIFKPQISLDIIQITNQDNLITNTTRNSGGFGSSN